MLVADIPQVPRHWGRILLEHIFRARETSRGALIACLICIPLGVTILVLTYEATKSPTPCIGLFLTGLGLLFGFVSIYSLKRGDEVVRFYEGGALRLNQRGTLLLDYQQILTMSCSVEIGNGLANCRLELIGTSDHLEWSEHLAAKVGKPGDQWVGQFNDVVAAVGDAITNRIYNELTAGRNVQLTKKLQLEPDGIRLLQSDEFVRYADLDAPIFEEAPASAGKLELTVGGKKVFSLAADADNYWPAKRLLEDGRGMLRQATT